MLTVLGELHDPGVTRDPFEHGRLDRADENPGGVEDVDFDETRLADSGPKTACRGTPAELHRVTRRVVEELPRHRRNGDEHEDQRAQHCDESVHEILLSGEAWSNCSDGKAYSCKAHDALIIFSFCFLVFKNASADHYT